MESPSFRGGLGLSLESIGASAGKGAMQARDAELGDLREGRSKHASRGPFMGSDAQLSPS